MEENAMSKNKNKKDPSEKLWERLMKERPVYESLWSDSEAIKYDLVMNQFHNLLGYYPKKDWKETKYKVGDYAKSLAGINEQYIPHTNPFPNLLIDDVLQRYHQDDLMYVENSIMYGLLHSDLDEYPMKRRVEMRSMVDQPYVHIDFVRRSQEKPLSNNEPVPLSHSIVSLVFTEDDHRQYRYVFPEHYLIDADLVAGDVDGQKRALLSVRLHGDPYCTELDEFSMISLVEKTEEKEKGLLTVFNKRYGILYSEFTEGKPTLKHPKYIFIPTKDNEPYKRYDPMGEIYTVVKKDEKVAKEAEAAIMRQYR
jgi:hypothetical protein